jgi:putative colanic acid biosynthesis UDP-glucose lipid carrier transferase
MEVLWVVCNLAMAIAMLRFGTIIHLRMVSGGDILRRVFELAITQTIIAYLIMKGIDVSQPVGWLLVSIGCCQIVQMTIFRLVERFFIKRFRQMGRNTRTVTFVGDDTELDSLYERLLNNPTMGYRIVGRYGNGNGNGNVNGNDNQNENKEIRRLGTVDELMAAIEADKDLELGDEVYVCLPRREREKLWALSEYCDSHVVRFYYVPASVERLGMRLKRELLEDMELFTTHEIPLENPANKALKRVFDIVLSIVALICCLPLLPFIIAIMLIQSPGPIFFRQKRTGVNGKDFMCYKFRSMHVNKEADTAQATEHDPRKYPFGNLMRKYNIDELPQFWNVLIGNMSVVGPRPHMLYHTDKYKQQIGNYMVRHFVKPGITGWAQVTGFRGETRELWQMEERVKRDIWYIEHWSIWLDLRIVWMTLKSVVIHDAKAY